METLLFVLALLAVGGVCIVFMVFAENAIDNYFTERERRLGVAPEQRNRPGAATTARGLTHGGGPHEHNED